MHTTIFWFELLAFTVSVTALPFMRNDKALRIYPLLLLIVILVEGYFQFFPAKNHVNATVYNIQVPLQYVCYLMILYFAATGSGLRQFLVAALLLLLVFNLITVAFFTPREYYNVWGYCFCSLSAIVGILYTFYEMLQKPLEFNFLRNPFFYMLFAFLLFNLITLPYFSMANWLYHTTNYRNLSLMLANVMSIMNYILYSTYTICFLWIIRRKATY